MYKANCIEQKNEKSYNHLNGLGNQYLNNFQLFADILDYVKTHLKLNSNIEKISVQLFIWFNSIIDAKGIYT